MSRVPRSRRQNWKVERIEDDLRPQMADGVKLLLGENTDPPETMFL